MDDVFRLAGVERYGHAASYVDRVHLQKAGVGRQRVQRTDSSSAKVVATNAAEDGGVIAQPPGHDCEIGRRATKALTVW